MNTVDIANEVVGSARMADNSVKIRHEIFTLDSDLWGADLGDKYQMDHGGVIVDAEIVQIEKMKSRSGCKLTVHFLGTCSSDQVATPID